MLRLRLEFVWPIGDDLHQPEACSTNVIGDKDSSVNGRA